MNSNRKNTSRCGMFSGMAIVAGFSWWCTPATAQEVTVRASIKFVLNAYGQRPAGIYQSDAAVRAAFTEANAALDNIGAGWGFEIDEIVDVAGISGWLTQDCAQKDGMEEQAKANAGVYRWRSDAINFYVLPLASCGGVCSFPHDADEIILINTNGILNDGVGWLHEVGHYLGLWHTHQCVYNYPNCQSDRYTCTGAGGVNPQGYWVTCPDSCPSTFNVMSYNSGITPGNAEFSPCQLNIMAQHLATDRSKVVGSRGTCSDEECDDGLFCSGQERCMNGTCIIGEPPCGSVGVCDESLDRCVAADDEFEENDSMGAAAWVREGAYENLMGSDFDWFVIDLDEGGELSVRISGIDGDLDLFAFDDEGQLLGSSISWSSIESIVLAEASGVVAIVVVPQEAAEYRLSVAFAATPEAGLGSSTPCGSGGEQALAFSMIGLAGFAPLVRGRRF